jgi:hypothetical protein
MEEMPANLKRRCMVEKHGEGREALQVYSDNTFPFPHFSKERKNRNSSRKD